MTIGSEIYENRNQPHFAHLSVWMTLSPAKPKQGKQRLDPAAASACGDSVAGGFETPIIALN
jgi:hypothetical protein